MTEQQLISINAKLTAVLGILIERQQREIGRSDRDVVVSLAAHGLSATEIAGILGKTPNAVKILLSRSRSKKSRKP